MGRKGGGREREGSQREGSRRAEARQKIGEGRWKGVELDGSRAMSKERERREDTG